MILENKIFCQNMFSLSTCWNVGRHSSGRMMAEEIKELGFESIELNYSVTDDMSKEILVMADKGDIKVSSIHNVFPHTENMDFGPDSMLLGFPDKDMRDEAIRLAIGSVEYAARVGARAVVIHPGEIPLPKSYNSLLERMILDEKKGTAEYMALLDEMLYARQKESPYYVSLIQQSLETICNHIIKKGYDVVLGLENRMMCHQIPVFYEINALLDNMPGLPVYFWFDIGHGLLMDNMGLFNCAEEVYKIKDKIIGLHIHDAVNTTDHLCPFLYSDNLIPFMDIIRHVPIKVLELQSRASAEDIKRSTEILMRKANEYVMDEY